MTVGIVGAGITGLSLARHLDRLDEPFVLYEATDEPGGVVRSRTVDGRVLDLGPQRTRLTPGVRDLVDAAGIEPRLRHGMERPLYVYHDGALRQVPTDLSSAVTTDLLSLRGKLRALCEPLSAPPDGDETVGHFLRRAFGDEVAERVVGPLYAGLYGSHPDEMYVRHSFGKAVEKLGSPRSLLLAAVRHRLGGGETPPVVSFEAGLQELAEGLADRYADRLELATPVESVETAAEGYRLVSNDGETVVDDVVCTTPARTTAALLDGIAPDAAASLRELRYSPLAVVHVAADGGLDAAGFQVGFDESFATLGVTSNHGLFGRHGLHTCYLGGRRDPAVLDESDEELGTTAAAEFGAITGLDAEPVAVHRIRPGMPSYDRSWAAIDDLSLPDGVHLCANYASRAGIPGRVRRARALAESLAE